MAEVPDEIPDDYEGCMDWLRKLSVAKRRIALASMKEEQREMNRIGMPWDGLKFFEMLLEIEAEECTAQLITRSKSNRLIPKGTGLS